MASSKSSRRLFIRKLTGTAVATSAAPSILAGHSPASHWLVIPRYDRKTYTLS